ncbi:4'-phosphopantetheinyl transferase family protein [Flocculibacter collagenilyticus]|uniref:4'-phosphopantetheinyl transferase family protein n=1 Tax=Flocculibacter collagenilyticus TaxID=2744479 RepID=UPI0018F5F978|nr:4'-phosphopantetheinyl transferase superfamily protein [Flocculibacter collagenilyticus]
MHFPTQTQTQPDSSHFIQQCGFIEMENMLNVKVFYCHYNTQYFNPDLFSEFGVDRPESVQGAVEKRQAEFLIGRYCAQQVLKHFKINALSIPVGTQRQPIWPQGVVASISHTDSIGMCALGIDNDTDFLGVDVERWLDLHTAAEIKQSIINIDEEHLLQSYSINDQYFSFEQLLTITFSAKETLFKALHKYVGQFFGFEAAEVVEFCANSKTISFVLTEHLSDELQQGMRFDCHFQVESDHIITLLSGQLAQQH